MTCRMGSALFLGFCALTASLFSQQSKKTLKPWELMMYSPKARAEAPKFLGHCGDAQTQDVINACFALDFQTADATMNKTYLALSKQLDADVKTRVRDAQRAWLRYRELHCAAVGAMWEGGSIQPSEVFGCKATLTKSRIKELKTDFQHP
jgi:uncharacterized protein YecT (DUF1311 family)